MSDELLQNPIIDKKSTEIRKLVLTEIAVYAFQVFVFALTAIFISGFFQNENALAMHIGERINELSVREFLFTILSIIVSAGLVAIASNMFGESFVDFLTEIVEELPRTIYFFGSSIGGALIALGLNSLSAGDARLGFSSVALALAFLVTFFIIGLFFKLLMKKRARKSD